MLNCQYIDFKWFMRPSGRAIRDGSSGLCIDHADIYKYLCRYVHGERGIGRPNCDRGNYGLIHLQLGNATTEGKMGIVDPARTVSVKIVKVCDAHQQSVLRVCF